MREFLLPLLLSARVVTRYCLPEGCGELPHVTRKLDALLNTFSANWTIVTAYKRTESLRCVQYVAAREVPETQDQFYKRWLLNETSELAASRGDLTTLRWLMECYLPVEPVENVVIKAAANGQFEILQWLYDQQRERVRFRDVEMCGALENKHENVVAWLRENAVPRTEYREEVLCSAVKAGNLDVVRWLCDEFGLDATGMLKFAINGCHEETARWVIDRYDVSGGKLDLYFLARHGKLSFLEYLASRDMATVHDGMLLVATANGHLDVVKWLHCEQGVILTTDAMREAAQNGYLDIVEWLYETSNALHVSYYDFTW
ncbi:hypothetical protein PC120_g24692 [Phytophthora cactorum]|nr:hypothetical protein PC120_g24692 [Phytophthora cactorum]